MAESARQKRMRELGVSKGSTSTKSSSSKPSSRQQRMIELGVMEEPKRDPSPANILRASTVMNPINTDLKVAANKLPKEDKFVSSFKQSAQRLADEKPKDTVRLAGKEFEVEDYSDHPSRDIPVVGSALKVLDKVKDFTLPFSKIAGELYTPGGGLTNAANMASNV